MDIWRVLSAIIRRWYVIVPLLVVTVVGALTIGNWVRPEYQSSAVISILPGKTTVQPRVNEPQVVNPYLALPYTAGILQYALTSSAVRQDLLTAGLTGAYDIKPVPRSSFIGITVTASDPELATATAHGIIERARRILAKRQSAIAGATTRVSIDVLDNGDSVAASTSGQLQASAAVLAVGGIVSVVITVLIDDLLILRRRRRDQQRNQEADVEAAPSSNGVISAADEAVVPSTRAER
jgi:capsular polysaccharide biosynthesis protein